jgi:hypothetical protein
MTKDSWFRSKPSSENPRRALNTSKQGIWYDVSEDWSKRSRVDLHLRAYSPLAQKASMTFSPRDCHGMNVCTGTLFQAPAKQSKVN